MKQESDNCSFLTDEDRAKINELLTNHPFSEKDLEDGMQQLMKFNVNDKPNKMKIIYTWHDLGRYAKNAAKSLLRGLIRLAWVIVLLVVNIIATALNWVKNAIKKKPCLSVLATFVVMLVFVAVVHMRMKVKLTTAEWQRDSLEMRLDSVKVINNNGNVSYFKYQQYKPKENGDSRRN
jgi:uncharacterized membrane protein YcjF (UPF0283 family)